MDLLVDVNILLAVALNEPEKIRIVELTTGVRLAAPEVMPFEIGNALSAMMKRQRITHEQAQNIFSILNAIPLMLKRVNIEQAIKLSSQFNIYASDAYYLETAQRLHVPLLTLDQQMKSVGRKLNINLIEI